MSGRFGLIGEKLGHSFSPMIHGKLADYDYSLFELGPDELEEFLRSGNFDGLNVTIPYKKAVIPFCQELTSQARRIGSVNTIVRRTDGSLLGHNTDYDGFSYLLRSAGAQVTGKKALVLGTGGASLTVHTVLRDMGVGESVSISRSGPDNYENLDHHADAQLIVNATPVGMYPNTGVSPVELARFPRLEGVFDLIYNPARTQLLLDGERLGATTANGLGMLVAQAKEAAEWFTGGKISNDVIEPILRKLERQMHNIVLIGMPGCGKTTVGSLLAEKTQLKFVDADVQIEQLAGKTIPQIFAQDGEEVFRNLETKVLANLGKQSGLIIATGGGCVTQERNYDLLHQNGDIYWIHRDLADLSTEGRPLSQKANLKEMYRVRVPMYNRFKDWNIMNNGSPEEAARQIIHIWENER